MKRKVRRGSVGVAESFEIKVYRQGLKDGYNLRQTLQRSRKLSLRRLDVEALIDKGEFDSEIGIGQCTMPEWA